MPTQWPLGWQTAGAASQLGQAVNLLHSMRGNLFGPAALELARRQPLRLFPPEPLTAGSGWQEISVTFHEDVECLMDRLWNCKVAPHRHDGPGFEVNANILVDMCERETRRALLATHLGMTGAEGSPCLLLELCRDDGRADHEVTACPPRRFFDRDWHLTADWRRAVARLRPGQRIHDGTQHDALVSAAEAQAYVDAFYRFGTHFVSAVEMGDKLVQVVALKPESAGWIGAYWRQTGRGKPVSGVAAMAFAAFLAPPHARQVGPICSLADDPHLPASLTQGAWNDPACLTGVNLAALFRSGKGQAKDVLADFAASTQVHAELTSLALFTEFYRAINFERILRGALAQRWGARVHLPLRRMPAFQRQTEGTTLCSGPPVTGCRKMLRLIAGDDGTALAGPLPVLAQFVDAAAFSSRALHVHLDDAAFEQAPFACQTMAGVAVLENQSRTRRDTLVDGLRFSDVLPGPEGGQARIKVAGDVHRIAPDRLPELLPQIREALLGVAVALSAAGAAKADRQATASTAGWLASQLDGAAAAPGVEAVTTLAHFLADKAGLPPSRPPHLPAKIRSAMHNPCVRLGMAGVEADELLRSADAGYGATPAGRMRMLRQEVTAAWQEMLALVRPVTGWPGQSQPSAGYALQMANWWECVHACAGHAFDGADLPGLERLLLLALLGEATQLFHAALENAGFEAPDVLDSLEPGAIGFLLLQNADLLLPHSLAIEAGTPTRQRA